MSTQIKNYNVDEERPNPDMLLAAVKKDNEASNKGKLKIFLGAAPGVGKTYAMLEAAHNALENGINVVVGAIETHGRAETEELLDGLTQAPKKEIIYKGKTFYELNTEEIIKTKPELVLIDELPHRNARGATNNKRYQDIIDILDAGIDVYTAVNVQHIESLKDDIYQITKIGVNETVPDFIFELAHETVVTDIAPEELRERLKEGKIYIPDQAKLALDNFFAESNISALRAMALQVAAKSISNRVISYKQTHGINEPWAIADKVLVCLSDSSFTPSLVRAARKLSSRVNGTLLAIYIDTPLRTMNEAGKKRLSNYKKYAEYMGAEVVSLSASNVSKAILKYAEENNVTHIVLSKTAHSRVIEFMVGSVVHDVIRNSGKINIHILSERPKEDRTNYFRMFLKKFFFRKDSKLDSVKMMKGIVPILILAYLGYQLKRHDFIDNAPILLSFLLTIVYSANRLGFYYAIASTVAGGILFGYIFEEPAFEWNIYNTSGVLSLFTFLSVSYIIIRMSHILNEQLNKTQYREKAITALYNYSRNLIKASTIDDLSLLAEQNLSSILKQPTSIFIANSNGIEELPSAGKKGVGLEAKEKAALNWTWAHGKESGSGTDTLSSSSWYFYPMIMAEEVVGVIGIKLDDKSSIDPEISDYIQSISDQTAIAITRIRLLSAVATPVVK